LTQAKPAEVTKLVRVSTGFIIVTPNDDAIGRLRAAFPDIWNDLLEVSDPDTPFLLYFAFAELLLARRGDTELWQRAYRFFDEVAECSGGEVSSVLTEAFDRLWDSEMRDVIDKNLGSVAQRLFRCSKI
jgi:hypothetical protein